MLLSLTLLLAAYAGDAGYQVEISPAVEAAIAAQDETGTTALIAQLSALSDAGDTGASELLGEAHQLGKFGLKPDVAKACDYYDKAAVDRADSAHNLATCFYDGRGRSRDRAKARNLYQRASDGGFPKAHCAFGNMLLAGDGGPQDIATGLSLCRKSAELGVADAQTDLGGYLLTGEYVDKDVVAARNWLQMAADQKQANAAFLLAQIYWNGDGVATDRATAKHWWQVAHDGGRPDAAYWVTRSLIQQMLSERDGKQVFDRAFAPEALKWARIAAQIDPSAERRETATSLIAELEKLIAGAAN